MRRVFVCARIGTALSEASKLSYTLMNEAHRAVPVQQGGSDFLTYEDQNVMANGIPLA